VYRESKKASKTISQGKSGERIISMRRGGGGATLRQGGGDSKDRARSYWRAASERLCHQGEGGGEERVAVGERGKTRNS